MQSITRKSVGIDIAKATFTACMATTEGNTTIQFSEVVLFPNSKAGFNQLLKWVRKVKAPLNEFVFVMEATGIYYEPLAYHLNKLHLQVAVLLPNKVKHYGKSLNIKSKTDCIDARIIAQMGAERSLQLWQPPTPALKQLRELTRLYTDLKAQRTAFVNRLQAVEAGSDPLDFIVHSTHSVIKKLDVEIRKCVAQIEKLLGSASWLQQKVDKLMSIKGVGLITVAIVVAETQGFQYIENAKQLTSYAGYDVVETQSGSSVRGRTRISKKGNSRIRAALHFPALVAARHNQNLQGAYQRINQNKTSKMVGATAVQRKLLILLYILWKNDTVYDENKANQTSGNQETKPLLRLSDEVADHKEVADPKKKAGRPKSLPAQDELPLNQSTEALLRLR
jgi:transposase